MVAVCDLILDVLLIFHELLLYRKDSLVESLTLTEVLISLLNNLLVLYRQTIPFSGDLVENIFNLFGIRLLVRMLAVDVGKLLLEGNFHNSLDHGKGGFSSVLLRADSFKQGALCLTMDGTVHYRRDNGEELILRDVVPWRLRLVLHDSRHH